MNRNAEEEAIGSFDINESYHTSGSDVRLPDGMFDKPKPLPEKTERKLLTEAALVLSTLLQLEGHYSLEVMQDSTNTLSKIASWLEATR